MVQVRVWKRLCCGLFVESGEEVLGDEVAEM